MRYKQSESAAERRWIMFFCADDDAGDNYAPKTGLTFGLGDLKVAKAGSAWADATGTTANGRVVEIGGGWYWYQFSATELNTLGALGLFTNVTDVYSDGSRAEVVVLDQYNASSGGMVNLDATVSSCLPSATAAEVWDLADGVETDMTPRQALRLVAAILGGQTEGADTNSEKFLAAVANHKIRATVTLVGSDRSSVAVDLD